MDICYRPILSADPVPAPGAQRLAGGPLWFTHAEVIARGAPARRIPEEEIPEAHLQALTAPRAPLAGVEMTGGGPRVMGILNATPDSFSDGGLFEAREAALAQARAMVAAGAEILDIGGESTRPGATEVAPEDEAARILPLIEELAPSLGAPISVDTRKAEVGRAGLSAGAVMLNDVSGLDFDPGMAALAAEMGAPICVMHAQGRPETMQDDPAYENVTLDVLGFLEERVARLEAAGLPRDKVVVDPGIGFGKTVEHNLELLRNIAVFHNLGCPVLLGVSRKGFIGHISGETEARARAPGSIAVALAALGQGVQIFRVHDVAETVQAFKLWQSVTGQRHDT